MEDLGLSFAGRTVFLTGHTGFKGSWLALWLAELGAKVVGYALPAPTQPSNFVASRVGERLVGHHDGDIRDAARLAEAVAGARPDVVFHLAAQALVRESYAAPAATFATNVQGTVNLLEAVRLLDGPCRVVVVTSDKCYENADPSRACVESDRMGGRDPYSASKGAAELAVRSYRESFFPSARRSSHGKQLASVRAGNVIGGGDWARDRLVVDLALACAAGQPARLRHPGSIRPWQHVLDALYGYLTLAARMLRDHADWLCDGWNFGPDETSLWSVERVAAAFCAAWPDGRWEPASDEPTVAVEAASLRLDAAKARARLGWSPRWDTLRAIAETVSWYRRFYARPGADMQAACREQIRDYLAPQA